VIPRVGIVVPTLGKRPDYLQQCLESIRAAGEAHVCLVAPKDFDHSQFLAVGLVQQFVIDPGHGLSEAINAGIEQLPKEVLYVNWLGDDDLLAPGSLEKAASLLDREPGTLLVYGSCDYVDPSGNVVWKNSSGQWASALLHFGPDLIPQPGSLFRRAAFESVGGLSNSYDWAFDFDLLLKLKKLGKLRFLNQTLASFRWHPESLSVEYRTMSVAEASKVRISHLPALLRPISCIWEYPVRQATLIAGNQVTARAKKKAKQS
jgi:GT2 family glycosyltransferase